MLAQAPCDFLFLGDLDFHRRETFALVRPVAEWLRRRKPAGTPPIRARFHFHDFRRFSANVWCAHRSSINHPAAFDDKVFEIFLADRTMCRTRRACSQGLGDHGRPRPSSSVQGRARCPQRRDPFLFSTRRVGDAAPYLVHSSPDSCFIFCFVADVRRTRYFLLNSAPSRTSEN